MRQFVPARIGRPRPGRSRGRADAGAHARPSSSRTVRPATSRSTLAFRGVLEQTRASEPSISPRSASTRRRSRGWRRRSAAGSRAAPGRRPACAPAPRPRSGPNPDGLPHRLGQSRRRRAAARRGGARHRHRRDPRRLPGARPDLQRLPRPVPGPRGLSDGRRRAACGPRLGLADAPVPLGAGRAVRRAMVVGQGRADRDPHRRRPDADRPASSSA